jgi:hypothetical protein
LNGECAIGVYQLGLDNKVKWICLDIDSHDPEKDEEAEADTLKLCNYMKTANIPYLLEKSGSPHSYHIWVFVEPVEASKAKEFGTLIQREAGVKCELWPKQVELKADDVGSQVKMPLCIHQVHGTRSQIEINGEFVSEFSKLDIGILDISGIELPKKKTLFKPKVRPSEPAEEIVNTTLAPCISPTEIRPCLQSALNEQLTGDAGNFMRIAVCREHYKAGMKDHKKLSYLYRKQRDFDEGKSMYHVERVLAKQVPYISCRTLREKGKHFVNCSKCPNRHSSIQRNRNIEEVDTAG